MQNANAICSFFFLLLSQVVNILHFAVYITVTCSLNLFITLPQYTTKQQHPIILQSYLIAHHQHESFQWPQEPVKTNPIGADYTHHNGDNSEQKSGPLSINHQIGAFNLRAKKFNEQQCDLANSLTNGRVGSNFLQIS